MTDWMAEMTQALDDFLIVANLAHVPLLPGDLRIEYLQAPHKPPPRLPSGKMAIYGYWHAGGWLKIGMAGPKSNARYTSQHYSPRSAPSTLAASLLSDADRLENAEVVPDGIGQWIKSECNRVNILLDDSHGVLLLALLEGFLHVRLRPRYER